MATTFYLKDTGTLSWNAANTKITAPVGGTLSISAGASIFFDTGGNDKMMIDAGGNVGIGTNEPSEKLEVFPNTDVTAIIGKAAIGHVSSSDNWAGFSHYAKKDSAASAALRQNSSGSTIVNSSSGQYLTLRINNTEKLTIKPDGYVGIGTTIPLAPLHVSGVATQPSVATKYFHASSGTTLEAATTTFDASILTTGGILATGNAIGIRSDSRIKKNITEIVDDEALEKLRLLKPSKYNYIDEIKRGTGDVYGFIAQEVRDVFPYAVKTSAPDYLPNIYKGGTYNNNNITLLEPHGLTENGNIKLLITTKARDINCPYTVVDTLKISIDTTNLSENDIPSNDSLYDEDGTQLDFNIFVYGTLVNDPLVLQKDAIWSVATAALQEVDRIQQSNNIKIQDLITQLDAEKVKVSDLLARVTALENP